MTVPFLEDNDQTQARREHLEALRRLVGNVYPNKFERSNVTENPSGEDTITSIVDAFKKFEPQVAGGERPSSEALDIVNAQLSEKRVRIAGRMISPPRVMGKAAFFHLSDGKSRLQIYLRKTEIKGLNNSYKPLIDDLRKAATPDLDVPSRNVDGWGLFALLDQGDFVGIEGSLFVTKAGELSVRAEIIQFLSKALRPMPSKLRGISNAETRRRQRYADLIASSLRVKSKQASQQGDDVEPTKDEGLTPREVFELRYKVVREIRRFLDDHGYIEVETPMLTPLATGAAAKPFKTHHNALNIDLYARIAPELYLKRLVVGGFEKVYELNRNFRNEGISAKHNPEFTMLEFYMAYGDVNQMMGFAEELIVTAVERATGRKTVTFDIPIATQVVVMPDKRSDETRLLRFTEPIEINLGDPWRRLTMKEAITEYWRDVWYELGTERFNASWLDDSRRIRLLKEFIDLWIFLEVDLQCLVEHSNHVFDGASEIPEEGIAFDSSDIGVKNRLKVKAAEIWEQAKANLDQLSESPNYGPNQAGQDLAAIFEQVAEPFLIQPTFITGFPKSISPLSKASPSDPSIAERFEYFVGGLESGNGFSELNDPEEQYQRFKDQVVQREHGDEEAMVMDEDYIRALSYGMPPAAGIGIGIDRLVMLLANKQSIRDVIMFPHMRPERRVADDEQAEQ